MRNAVRTTPLERAIIDDPSRPEVGVPQDRIEKVFEPVEDWILVRLDKAMSKSKGGIYVPDPSRPDPRMGVIVKQGPGMLLEDGKTRAPMTGKIGDRIMFEFAAGKTVPRCPKYHILKNGSVEAIVAPDISDNDLEDEEAPRLTPGRVLPVQDWLLVKTDRRLAKKDVALHPGQMKNGRPLYLVGPGQEDQVEAWTGTVVRKGPGLLCVVRCVDGDRAEVAPPVSSMHWLDRGCQIRALKEGDRIYLGGDLIQEVPGLDGYVMARERLNVFGLA